MIQICKYTNTSLSKDTNIQTQKYTHVRIHEHTYLQMYESTNIHACKNNAKRAHIFANTKVHKYTTIQNTHKHKPRYNCTTTHMYTLQIYKYANKRWAITQR